MKKHMKKLLAIGAILLLSFTTIGCNKNKSEESSNYTITTSKTFGYQTVSVNKNFTYDIPQKWTVVDQNATDTSIVLVHTNSEKDEGMIVTAYQDDGKYDFSKSEDIERYISTSIKGDDTYQVKNESITLSDYSPAEKVTLKIKSENGDRDAIYILFNCKQGYAVVSMISAADSDFADKFDTITDSIIVKTK